MTNHTVLALLPANLALAATAVCAQPIKPIYGASAGAAAEIAIATTVPAAGGRASDVAAAVINGSGELEVIGWQDTNMKLQRVGSAGVPGKTTSVAITGLDSHRVVTASYDGNFNISVNTWEIGSGDQGVTRQNGDSSQPGVSVDVAITRLSSKRVAVAFVDPSDDNLFVYAYDIDAAGMPTQFAAWGLPGAADSAPGMLALAAIDSNLVMTATRDLSGNLQVRTWKIDASSVDVVDTYTAGAVQALSLGANVGSGSAMTASENGSGDLENIYWSLSASGHITRGASAIAGRVTATASAWLPSDIRITAVRSAHGQLDVEQWQPPFLASNGMIGSYDSTSAITQLALTPEGSGPEEDDEIENYFVTGAISKAGDLEVEVWQTPMAITPPPK